MSIHNRLNKLEQQSRPQSDISFPTMPTHTLEDATAIICELYHLGVLPDNPPTHWTSDMLAIAKEVVQ